MSTCLVYDTETPMKTRTMKTTKQSLVVTAIACASALSMGILTTACSKKGIVARPEFKAITEAVYASGSVLPQHEYKIVAMADGILTKRLVEEGAVIQPGQVLFVLDNEEQAARNQAAREVFKTAEQNLGSNSPALQELSAQLATAQAKFRNDSLNYARSRELFEARSIAQAEFDRATLAFQSAQNDFTAAQKRVQKLRNQLFVEWQNAQSQYKVAAKQDANFTLKSWIHGMVYEIYKQEGEVVKRNEAVALIGDASKTYVRLSVDELDVNKIRTGQDVLVKMDVYKGQIFKAKVTKIYPMLNKQDQSFRVDAEFVDTMPNTFAGLSVEANIVVAQKDRAMVIPRGLVTAGDSVVVEQNGKPQKIRITKGIETFDYVEVLGGLDSQATLIVAK